MKRVISSFFVFLTILLVGCNNKVETEMKSSFSKTVNIQEIPMDVALSTLSTFMERVYP